MFKNAVPNYAFLKFTTDMIDDFSKRSIIDPLHRQVTSIASLEWIKVFSPFISPTVTERLHNQCTGATYMGSCGAKLPQSVTGHMEQWLLNPGAPRTPSGHKTWQLNLTALSQIYLFIYPWESAQKRIMCVTALSMEKEVQERLLHRQSASCAAVRLSLQSAVMEWWMLWRTDTLFSPPMLPVDMPHSSCLLFHKLCYSPGAARCPFPLLMRLMAFIACLIPSDGGRKKINETRAKWSPISQTNSLTTTGLTFHGFSLVVYRE